VKAFQKKNKKENHFIFPFVSFESSIVYFAWKGENNSFLGFKDSSCFFLEGIFRV
jgi:hypothetical protein